MTRIPSVPKPSSTNIGTGHEHNWDMGENKFHKLLIIINITIMSIHFLIKF